MQIQSNPNRYGLGLANKYCHGMAWREGRNVLPHSFFTPLTLPAHIIVDLAFSLPCWRVRLDRCCVELYYVLEMLLLFSMATTTL